jgi:hypothetical protein
LFLAATDGEQRVEIEIQPAREVSLRLNGERVLTRSISQSFRGPVDLEFGLCDGQVFLVANGQPIISHSYSRRQPSPSVLHPLAIGASQHRVAVQRLRVWRDIYYLDPRGLPGRWTSLEKLDADAVALLGDNQPVSVDSRHREPPGIPRSALLGLVYKPFWAASAHADH